MATSPGSASSKGNGDSYGQLLDERDFDDVLLVPEPGSEVTKEAQSGGRQPKKFFASRDEISETVLAEGFSFPRREPPRPGQFSKRPLHGSPRLPRLAEPKHQDKNASRQASASPLSKGAIPRHLPKGGPLDLPELCLPSHPATTESVKSRREVHAAPQSVALSSLHSSDGQHFSQRPRLKNSPASDPAGTLDRVSPSRVILTSFPPKTLSSEGVEKVKTVTNAFSSPKPASYSASDRRDDPPKVARAYNDVFHHVKDYPHNSELRPHAVQRVSRSQRQQSPASTCGDLEGPTHRSPTRSRRYSRDDLAKRSTGCHTPKDRGKVPLRRSQSRASNISRKRASAHKHRSRSDPERKKLAMHQVAQHWNECIQIAEEEIMQANLEIERLQEDIGRQEQELRDSRANLKQKDSSLVEIEQRFKDLQEEDSRALGENKILSDEVESLRDQLSESKERGEALADRHRTYRAKLNEAIKEQQTLFLHSRSFYQKTMDQLRKENARKAVDSQAIDEALENSRKKREEMKKCIEEFRLETEKETRKKDQAITELKKKIKDHEVSLQHEKDLTDRLRTQIEAQRNTDQAMQGLEAKIDSLQTLYTKSEAERQKEHQKSSQIMSQIHSKLDSITADNKLSASNMLSLDDLKRSLRDVQDKVVARVLPAVLAIINRQSGIGSAISQLETSINKDLDGIRGEMDQHHKMCGQSRADDEEQAHRFLGQLKQFGEDLKKTQGSCENIKHRLDAWTEGERTQQEAANSRVHDLTQQLLDRGARINDLEQQLQLACERYAVKVEAMRADTLKDGETAKKIMQEATVDLRSTLDEGFERERERTKQIIFQNEAAMATLRAKLNEAKEQLAKSSPDGSPDIRSLQTSLQSEQDIVAQLKRKVNELEEKSKINEQLQERWRQDIQAIDALRSQIKVVQERMPQVEGFTTKLDKVVELNGFIQSTACYLATEREWVRRQLDEQAPLQTSMMTSSVSSNNKPLVVAGAMVSLEDSQSCTVGEYFDRTGQPSHMEELPYRKVTVHSPALHADSPSPPPSVHQEQRRRREVTQLRSILKNNATFELEPVPLEGSSLRPQADHSKHSRPVVGIINSAGAALASEVVAEIRSGLIQQRDWRLPTVADFERDNHLTSSSKGQATHDKRALSRCEETNERDAKKLRAEQNTAHNEEWKQ